MTGVFEAVAQRQVHSVASADGTRLHVEEFGRSDGQAVVLAHGWTCSIAFWAPVIRLLSSDCRVIAYDQRGHGRSAVPATRTGYSTGALADDLEAVLEAVVPDGQRVVLVGHSMGGMTIMAASGRAAVTRRTAAVLLASTGSARLLGNTQVLPPRLSARWLRRALHRQLLVSRLPLGPVTPLSRAALAYGVLGTSPTREQAAFTARIVHACKSRQRAAWGRVLAGLDLDAEVAALQAPTAVLVGTHDKLTPKAHSQGMAQALPHCVGLTELAGLGHMTPIEDPDAVSSAIRSLAAAYAAPNGEGQGGTGAGASDGIVEEKSV